MNNRQGKAEKVAVTVSADNRFSPNLMTFFIVGAGLGVVLGILFGDLVAGITYGSGAGMVVGSVVEMFRCRTDQPKTTPLGVRPFSLRCLLGCLAFLGVSATFGGVVLVGSPSGRWLHIPLSVLQYSPFSDFLIPGLILGLLFGFGSFVTVLALWWRPTWPAARVFARLTGEHWGWSAALAIGTGQIIWIVVETVMVRGIDGLQVL
ncbi:hypothetical protein [Deinococcus alpinitundrae]|uniref:hypothetical protein n=1 Tax=Deinococcus alpinitundrae TaxID=468913 RepID=UPI00137B3011|nr:hypothetical protein [Deinococcus alpinitundrae]